MINFFIDINSFFICSMVLDIKISKWITYGASKSLMF